MASLEDTRSKSTNVKKNKQAKSRSSHTFQNKNKKQPCN